MPAGYSGTPLAKKLGWKERQIVYVQDAPDGYWSDVEVSGATFLGRLASDLQGAHIFVRSRRELEKRFPVVRDHLDGAAPLWVSWPKKASGVETDLDGNVVREIGLAAGLVDVKVCAVDDVWSGLKFVRRVRDR